MADLYLTRHGQASFGSANYDQLSQLGVQQCRWLGEYFRERNIRFNRIICGTQQRHQQSARAICEGLGQDVEFEIHAGFNEFDFATLLECFGQAYPNQAITDWTIPRDVYRCLRVAMLAWSEGRLPEDTSLESWSDFSQRVADALDFAQELPSGKTLVASSGGAISMALSQIMGFVPQTVVNLNLQSRNSSITHCYYSPNATYVTGINAVPHLDTPERWDSVTYS